MAILVEDVVYDVLSRRDRHGILYRAVTGAWSDYQKSSEAGRWRRKRTRAAIVWERMIDRALLDFTDDGNIQSIEIDDTIVFVIEKIVLLRFKKSDNSSLTRNYPTGTALLFHNHDEMLPGVVPHEHRIEVTYVLNDRETVVEAVRVIARDGSVVIWQYEIGEGLAIPEPLPLIPTAPRPTAGLVRVRSGHIDQKSHDGKK